MQHFSERLLCYHRGQGVGFDPLFFAMKLIDVTVPLDASLPNYPGNQPFVLEAVKRLANGDSSNVSAIRMSAHAGTHVDAPRHYFDDAAGIEGLALEMLLGRTRVIEVTSR